MLGALLSESRKGPLLKVLSRLFENSKSETELNFWFIIDTKGWTFVRIRTTIGLPVCHSDVQIWSTFLNKALKLDKIIDCEIIVSRRIAFDPSLIICLVIEVVEEVFVELFHSFTNV